MTVTVSAAHRPHTPALRAPRSVCRNHTRYRAGCPDCQAASAARKRTRARLVAYGQWEARVDAAPVRAHLRQLVEAGTTWATIAAVSGVGRSTIGAIAAGRLTVLSVTAQALLAVPVKQSPTTLVSSLGAARRLQALMAIGWSAETLAQRLGVMPTEVLRWRRRTRPQIVYRRHQQIAVLYRELECRPGPCAWSVRRAASLGYALPAHWDDDGDLDRPKARPKGILTAVA